MEGLASSAGSSRLWRPFPIFTDLALGDENDVGSVTKRAEVGKCALRSSPLTKVPQRQHWVTGAPVLAPTSSKSDTEGVGVAVASPRRSRRNGDGPPSASLPLARLPFPVRGSGDSVAALGCFQLPFRHAQEKASWTPLETFTQGSVAASRPFPGEKVTFENDYGHHLSQKQPRLRDLGAGRDLQEEPA